MEYIGSGGSSSHLQSDWMAWPWGTALQYLERRVAEMEMGSLHYQGTQLHLEIVVAISNCHLLHYKRRRSYFERNVYHPDNVHFTQVSSSAYTFKRSVWFVWKEVLCGLLLTIEQGRGSESQWIMATLTSCQPDEDILRGKVWWTAVAVVLPFPLQSAPGPSRNAQRSARAPDVSFEVCASSSNDATSSFKIFPARYILESLVAVAWRLS